MAVINHYVEKQLGKERVHFTLQFISLSIFEKGMSGPEPRGRN